MVITTIIEIPEGSSNKYEYDVETGRMRLDRVLFSAMHYPVNYGFIPETWAEDNDPLDVLIVGSGAIDPGVQVEVRVLGALLMEDEHGPDAKIIGVVHRDPRFDHIVELGGLGDHRLREIQHFFQEYKTLQGITTQVGSYQGEATAAQLLEQSRERFLARPRQGGSSDA